MRLGGLMGGLRRPGLLPRLKEGVDCGFQAGQKVDKYSKVFRC